MHLDSTPIKSRNGFKPKYLAYLIAAIAFYFAIANSNNLAFILPQLSSLLGIIGVMLFINKPRLEGTATLFSKYAINIMLVQLLFLGASIALFFVFNLQASVHYKTSNLYFIASRDNILSIYGTIILTVVVAYRIGISYYNNKLSAGIAGIILPKADKHPWVFVRNFFSITVLASSAVPIVIISANIILVLLHFLSVALGFSSPLENYFLLSVVGILVFSIVKRPLNSCLRAAMRRNLSLAKTLLFYVPLLAIIWILSYYCIYEFGNAFSTASLDSSFLDKTSHGPALLLWSWFFLSIPVIASKIASLSQGRNFTEILLASVILPTFISLLLNIEVITITNIDFTAIHLQALSFIILVVSLYFSCNHIYAVHHFANGFMPVTAEVKKRALIKFLVPLSSVIALTTSASLMMGWQLAQILTTVVAILLLVVLFILLASYIKGLMA